MSVGFVKFCLGFLKAFRWFPWGFLRFAGSLRSALFR